MPFDSNPGADIALEEKRRRQLAMADVFEKVLELFGDHGQRWGKGSYQRCGSFCLIGGLMYVAAPQSNELYNELYMDCCKELQERVRPGSYGVEDWNDSQQSFEPVSRLLTSAIIDLRS